jgi:hypothetical protein
MDPAIYAEVVKAALATTDKIIEHERYMMEQMSPEKRQAYADSWADPRIWWQKIFGKLGDLLDG